ncbi:site-specific integrase [Rhodoferax sp. TS-BS-61-7]|uniref:site-specific integrase n=1 Tax=Rhodoferax sp. TS-BS-61-7 TaxID=2094194 RepID=UPI000CF62045|nr:site-specific integrase [Rhodoferax sp. TS-BS-61-7]PQA78370.1 integrase [Rhodoferax sp. TS-BS-61-7]
MRLPALQKIPALQPTELSDVTQRAVNDLLREGESQNTQASYRSALRYWSAWYGIRYGQQVQLPLPAACVMQFIVDHAERSTDKGLASELPADIDLALVQAGYKGKLGAMAHSTLVHRIAVLSKAHQMREVKNPCQDPKVRELLSRTRKAYAKRGALPRKKQALTKDPLQALLNTCDASLKGARDRALLLFAWASGGRRRSEVTQAQLESLRAVGADGYLYTLNHSKTNQAGIDQPENHKPVTGIAAVAMKEWLEASRITSGSIFRRIRKGGHLGEPLSPAAVRDIVKSRCALAGIEGDFSAHSLRSGFVTEAGRQHIPLAETMAMTGHHSVATVLGYFRSESSLSSAATQLLD